MILPEPTVDAGWLEEEESARLNAEVSDAFLRRNRERLEKRTKAWLKAEIAKAPPYEGRGCMLVTEMDSAAFTALVVEIHNDAIESAAQLLNCYRSRFEPLEEQLDPDVALRTRWKAAT